MKTSQVNNKKQKKIRIILPYMQKRLAFAFAIIMLALLALIIRLFILQKTKASEYNLKILSQQEYSSIKLPYKRGDILDRNGTYLAISQKVYDLILEPLHINSNDKAVVDDTINLLSEVFAYKADDIKKVLSEKEDSLYVKYDEKISFEKKEEFEEKLKKYNSAKENRKKNRAISGILLQENYTRKYPYKTLASNIIGFVNSDMSKATGGIEQYYNSELIGNYGRAYGYLNDDSNLERVIKLPTNGYNIISTIDINLQKIVEKYIDQWENEAKSKITAVLMMNVKNGEILALATSRKFDLNNPTDLSYYYTDEEIAAMDDNAKYNAYNNIWRNFAISDTYEPGSPSKIFTVAAGLEENVIGKDETFLCDGGQVIGKWTIHCVLRTGHGILSLAESLMVSCNDVMMQIAARLGKDNFAKYMDIFGFGKKTDIDLPSEADTSALIHKKENMSAVDLATNAFGQNYNTTMIQMASATCSVVNGGYYYKPHIVKQILNDNKQIIENIEPQLVKETVSDKTSKFINETLRRTVDEGTGAMAKVEGYNIGGKTGTAEKYPRGSGKYLVSFMGIAPTDNPQILCYVIIDEPGKEQQAHSGYASALFSNIMKEALPYMNIFPENNESLEANLKEGINADNIEENVKKQSEEESKTEETKVYETEEAVPDDGNSLPDISEDNIEQQSQAQAETQAAETNENQ